MKTKRHPDRRQWFIDPSVQKDLMMRFVYYWASAMLFLTLPIAIIRSVASPEQSFVQHLLNAFATHWPILVSLSLMLPLAARDMLKFSNRFAGPIYRLRRELNRFSETEEIGEVEFRQGDKWRDVADGINELVRYVHKLEQELVDSRSAHADHYSDHPESSVVAKTT